MGRGLEGVEYFKPSLSRAEQTFFSPNLLRNLGYLGQHADVTLAELGQAWQQHAGRPVGQTCLWNVLDAHGLRRKKSLHATERDTLRVRTARAAHGARVCTRSDVARFHFLDETALRLDYTRRYARATDGRRVGGAVPLTRGKSLTLIGALSVQRLGALNQYRFA